jgi:hypothetical protein
MKRALGKVVSRERPPAAGTEKLPFKLLRSLGRAADLTYCVPDYHYEPEDDREPEGNYGSKSDAYWGFYRAYRKHFRGDFERWLDSPDGREELEQYVDDDDELEQMKKKGPNSWGRKLFKRWEKEPPDNDEISFYIESEFYGDGPARAFVDFLKLNSSLPRRWWMYQDLCLSGWEFAGQDYDDRDGLHILVSHPECKESFCLFCNEHHLETKNGWYHEEIPGRISPVRPEAIAAKKARDFADMLSNALRKATREFLDCHKEEIALITFLEVKNGRPNIDGICYAGGLENAGWKSEGFCYVGGKPHLVLRNLVTGGLFCATCGPLPDGDALHADRTEEIDIPASVQRVIDNKEEKMKTLKKEIKKAEREAKKRGESYWSLPEVKSPSRVWGGYGINTGAKEEP